MSTPVRFQLVPSECVEIPDRAEEAVTLEGSAELLLHSVKRLLTSAGCVQPSHATEFELLVIVPRPDDRLSTADLKWLREHGGQDNPCFLVIDAYDKFPRIRGDLLPWLRVVRLADSRLDELAGWIRQIPQADSAENDGKRSRALIGEIKRRIARHGLGMDQIDGFDNYLEREDVTKYIGAKTTPILLKSNEAIPFYYGLIRLGGKYDRIEHDLNKLAAEQSAGASESKVNCEMGALLQRRRFIDACVDKLTLLRHPVPDPEPIKGEKGEFRNVILLVDDKPERIKDELARIVEGCCAGNKESKWYELWVWRPPYRAENPELTLWDVARYNSLSGREKLEQAEIYIDRLKFDGNALQTESIGTKGLYDVLTRAAYVLVDVLFDLPGGDERDMGSQLISGFIRIFHELPDRAPADSNNVQRKLPGFLALSRANDMEKVQACLLAGANGYVLKSRLLGLPAMLGRIVRPVSEPVGTYHRNFRRLYDLPNEVVGSLKAAIINGGSGRVDLSRDTAGKDSVSQKGEERRIAAARREAMAELIRAVPKSDLHIHVGSVMTPEFLVVASLIMLARHAPQTKAQDKLLAAILPLFRFWSSSEGWSVVLHVENSEQEEGCLRLPLAMWPGLYDQAVKDFAECVGKNLVEQHEWSALRSLLHRRLGVRDHWSKDRFRKAVKGIPPIVLMVFALTEGALVYEGSDEGNEEIKLGIDEGFDIIRLFIVFLATRYTQSSVRLWTDLGRKPQELLEAFCSVSSDSFEEEVRGKLDLVNDLLFRPGLDSWRDAAWTLQSPKGSPCPRFGVDLGIQRRSPLDPCPSFSDSPLEFLIATGTRSRNLNEYLQGSEYAGAEHLRHGYLIHLYAQQTLEYFVEHGVLYAELRAAASGYVNPDLSFDYEKVCNCLREAFRAAQVRVIEEYGDSKADRLASTAADDRQSPIWLWHTKKSVKNDSLFKPSVNELFDSSSTPGMFERFPAKANILLTGKRHKPSPQMMKEAAAIVMLHTTPGMAKPSAGDFVSNEMKDCRMAGFDLAGPEEAFPPEGFREEFERLSRLHIPITAHAGENAPAQFVQSAVLDLRAKRIGHGLAVVEDKQLRSSVRDHRACLELCPVSNFQTNTFDVSVGNASGRGRKYPLKELLENGNPVSVNTDNPIISYTNITKEYFQASYACGEEGLSLWDALRIVRLGFVHSFMGLPEKRAVLELADQVLFDLFSREDVHALLRELREQQ